MVTARFPKLFHNLGRFRTYEESLPNRYSFMNMHAVTFALNFFQRIPIALMSKVHSELPCMEEKIISQAKEPTDWYTGMVVIPKAGR